MGTWQVVWWCAVSGITSAFITWIYCAAPAPEPDRQPRDPRYPDLLENPERRTT